MLKGVATVVTGGASGMGLATAELLAARGAHVVVLDVQGGRARDLAQRVAGLHAVTGTVTDPEAISRAFCMAASLGPVRGVVHCAGTSSAHETYNFYRDRPHDLKDFQNAVREKAIGTYLVLSAAARAGVATVAVSGAAGEGGRGGAARAAGEAAAGAVLRGRGAGVLPGLVSGRLLRDLPPRAAAYLARQAPCPARPAQPEEWARLAVRALLCPALAGRALRLDAGLRLAPL